MIMKVIIDNREGNGVSLHSCPTSHHSARVNPPLMQSQIFKPLSARSSRPLLSADRCDLLVPWSRTSLSQNLAFAVVGPALWNDTPALQSVMLQGISSASLRSLKTFLFTCLSR